MTIKHDESLTSASTGAEPTSSEADEVKKITLPELDSTESNITYTWTGRQRTGGSLTKGDLLDDRFMLVEILGSGVISTVYKAIDRNKPPENKERYVTIKVLKRQHQSSLERMVALAQAARQCQNLDHPNIARIHGFHREGATVYLRMEYLPGESLGQKIRWGVKRIPAKQAVHIVNEVGQALAYAHERGVVHDDLKPANIFLTDSGDVKVIDFGIAQALRRTAKDEPIAPNFGPDNYSASTPSYASPELLDLKEPDPRDDVYALACIAYELLAGRHPYGRVRATGARDYGLELKPSEAFTRAQWSSLQKALAFDRDKRTPTVMEFLKEFNASNNWIRNISLVAGLAVAYVAIGLLIYKQLPEVNTKDEPDLQSAESVGDIKLQPIVATPAQDDADSPTDIKTEPAMQSAESIVDISEPDSDEQKQVEVTLATPAQIDADTSADVKTDSVMQPAEPIADMSELDRNEQKQVEATLATPAQIEADTSADVKADSAMQPAEPIADMSEPDSDEQKQVEATVAASAHVDAKRAADVKPETATHLSTNGPSIIYANKPALERNEFATIIEVLPREKAKKVIPGAAAKQSANAAMQGPKEEMQSAALATQSGDMKSLKRQVADLLVVADNHMKARRLTLPVGKNALEIYREVLQLMPENEGAKQGIQNIKQQYSKWAEAAKNRGDWNKAKTYIKRALKVEPEGNAALLKALRKLEEASRAERGANS